MKNWLVKYKDEITTALGAFPAVAVAGYQTYEQVQGKAGNGTTIILACVMALTSYFTGKTQK